MRQTKINVNLAGLEKMQRELGNSYIGRVGVLGSHVARTDKSGISNSELMLIQMFGSKTNNIPPRDPLLAPIQMHKREIIKDMGSASVRDAFKRGNYLLVYQLLAQSAANFCHLAFDTGGFGLWPKLKPQTIARKGSSAILIDTRQLERSVTSDVVRKGENK